MQWRPLINTIAAIWLTTLPWLAQGGQCVERSWNQLIVQQKQLDTWYNQHAKKFNQFLDIYRQQVFLHRQFTQQQIVSFWSPNKPDLQRKMRAQIESSQQIAYHLQQEIDLLTEQERPVSELMAQWQTMSLACKQNKQAVNAHSSQQYVTQNQQLLAQLTQLSDKLVTLKHAYITESEQLTLAEQTASKADVKNKGAQNHSEGNK